jgi:hypothetical protein
MNLHQPQWFEINREPLGGTTHHVQPAAKRLSATASYKQQQLTLTG